MSLWLIIALASVGYISDTSLAADAQKEEKIETVQFKLLENNKTAGECFIIEVSHLPQYAKPMLKSKTFKSIQMYQTGENYIFIVPLDYNQKKGQHELECYIIDEWGEKSIEKINLSVKDRLFSKQYLKIDKKVAATTKNQKASEEFNKIFIPVRKNSASKAYFSEGFLWPLEGKRTTEYGMRRYVNGSLTSYRHSGVDIAAKTGTPIKATNAGQVVLSTYLIMTGHTVVIDHGLGIFSVYYHLNQRQVETHQMIERGQPIGTVGSTGFSTGPHLHFTMSHYDTNLDPDFFIGLTSEPLQSLYFPTGR